MCNRHTESLFAPPSHWPPFPTLLWVPGGLSSLDRVSGAPLFSGFQMGLPNRSSQGRRGKTVSIPLAACLRGGRVTVVHSSTQGQPRWPW